MMNIQYKPTPGDKIYVSFDDGIDLEYEIIEWGVPEWNQYWAILKKDDRVYTVNISHITSFSLEKDINASIQPKYIIKRGNKENKIIKELPENKKIVKEPELKLENGGIDIINRTKKLVDLYGERTNLVRAQIKDHLTNAELKPVEDNYAMPSFKKRST